MGQSECNRRKINGDSTQPIDSAIPASIMDAMEKTKPAIERIGLEVWNEAELSQAEHNPLQLTSSNWKPPASKLRVRRLAATPRRSWRSGEPGGGRSTASVFCQSLALPDWAMTPSVSKKAWQRQYQRSWLRPQPTRRRLHGRSHCTQACDGEDSIPGTLRVYGCASEEKEGVKY